MTPLILMLVLFSIPVAPIAFSADDKIKIDEIIAKHLDSIGTPDVRTAPHGRIIRGTSLVTLRQGGRGEAQGEVVLASQGNMNLMNMGFAAASYPAEAVGYDGKHVTTSQIKPGQRSPLAQVLFSHDEILKQGLIGGTLSAAWSFLNINERNPKLEYAGMKKVGDRQLHALKYTPQSGSDLRIKIFFDSESFRHVRTEYEREISASMPVRIAPSAPSAASERGQRSRDARFKIVEEFSDFKTEKGLTLPHKYKLELSIQSETNPRLVDWQFELTSFEIIRTIPPDQFSIVSN